MKKKQWLLFFLICIAVGGLLIYGTASIIRAPEIDSSSMNRIVKHAEECWDTKEFAPAPDCPYEYAVLDQNGALLYRSGINVRTGVFEAIRSGDAVLDVEKDGVLLGRILFAVDYQSLIGDGRKQVIKADILLLSCLLLPVGLLLLYLDRNLIRPFENLKGFARHVALGNLDAPLPMDKAHAFGAFTESFDLMRDQLKQARMNEAKANQSKKELTASLSHDMKTPVASIHLISELMLATTGDSRTREKLTVILQKSEQLEQLITNMLSASLEDLGEMRVQPAEESSEVLTEMIIRADYLEKADIQPIPGCILSLDVLRMEQVIDNIINNSYKYADTPIEVTASLRGDGLFLAFKDHGKGVPDEELPYLFQKYYRSPEKSAKTEGSGLGLSISRYLMDRMGGSIECANMADGFCVTLFLPLAGA